MHSFSYIADFAIHQCHSYNLSNLPLEILKYKQHKKQRTAMSQHLSDQEEITQNCGHCLDRRDYQKG